MSEIHPELARKRDRILAAMSALGFPMRQCQGVRELMTQQALFAQGRTAPGSIVTNADGVHHKSNHQIQSDGYGHAIDCCFVGADPWTGPWRVYGEMGKALGLKWGGEFTTIVDRPHLELL